MEETTMNDKEEKAIFRLKLAAEMSEHNYEKPLLITYSGGKDSDLVLLLAERAGIRFEVCHSHTTADAPQTVYYVRERFKQLEEKGIKCSYEYGVYKGKPASMWNLIPQKRMPPTRLVRYCCSVLKETAGDHRFIATGVRWAESAKRKNTAGIYQEINLHKKIDDRIVLTNDNDDRREFIDCCYLRRKMSVNPIIEWSDNEVWDYLSEAGIKGNPLYGEMGMKRVGCIGFPLASHKQQEYEFRLFPKYRALYVSAFDKMLAARREKGLTESSNSISWRNGEDVMRWWLGYDYTQITFADLEMLENEDPGE